MRVRRRMTPRQTDKTEKKTDGQAGRPSDANKFAYIAPA
jgi:hypothetical protein